MAYSAEAVAQGRIQDFQKKGAGGLDPRYEKRGGGGGGGGVGGGGVWLAHAHKDIAIDTRPYFLSR